MLLQLCQPLESSEAPEAVREVWVMVDEYMLTEAEVCLIKLLETLDKTALHAGCSAISPASTGHLQAQADDARDMAECCLDFPSRSSLEAAQLCQDQAVLVSASFAQQCSGPGLAKDCSGTMSASCSSSSNSDGAVSERQSSSAGAAMHLSGTPRGDVVPDLSVSHIHASAQGGFQVDTAASGEARGVVCASEAGRRLSLHSSASSLAPTAPDLHTPAHARPADSSDNKYHVLSGQSASALGAHDGTDTDREILGQGSHQAQQAAAYSLLCDPRADPQPKGSLAHDGCMDTISESPDEQQATNNMPMLIMKAKSLQVQCDRLPFVTAAYANIHPTHQYQMVLIRHLSSSKP